jgi:WD40 repeat protein
VKVLQGLKQHVSVLTFSPESLLLAAGGSVGRVEVWDVAGGMAARSGRKLARLTGMAFTPDSRTLMVWSDAGGGEVVKLTAPDWATTGRHLFSSSPALCFADLSPDGLLLVTAGWSALAAYSPVEFQEVWQYRLPLGVDPGKLMFSPDGQRIALERSVGQRRDRKDRYITVFSATDGEMQQRFQVQKNSYHLAAWSPDSRLLVTVGPRLAIWNVSTGKQVASHEAEQGGSFTAARFHPTESFLLATTGNGTVYVWSTEAWREVQRYAWECRNTQAMAVAPDGMRAAIGGDGGRIVVWDWDV